MIVLWGGGEPWNRHLSLPYSYETNPWHYGGFYPELYQDLQILSQIRSLDGTESIETLFGSLVQRNPTELHALHRGFWDLNRLDISDAFERILEASSITDTLKYVVMGLVLGPVLFDVWLIEVLTELRVLLTLRI